MPEVTARILATLEWVQRTYGNADLDAFRYGGD